MQIQKETIEPTKFKLTIKAEPGELDTIKKHVLAELSENVKVPGFRSGKAPATMVEKNIDPTRLQSEFVDHAINDMYSSAVSNQNLRTVAQPTISLTKFVPFTTLEFTAEVEAIGDIKLANYKLVKVTPKKSPVTTTEINQVIEDLRKRVTTKKEVKRAAKNGDELIIDFSGTHDKTKKSLEGGEGQDYPLTLGSKSFIPGFEEQLVGLKAAEKKEFPITFPADYGAKNLQKAKVRFEVSVKSVNELVKPKVDNKFAASIGPFKTVAELKTDIKKELATQKKQKAQQELDNELLEKLASKSEIAIPPTLVDGEIERIEEEEKRDVVYRGQTWQEHLDAEGVSGEEHRERQRPAAELRIKAGIILGEVADAEGITVTPEELQARLQALKTQYASDAAMLSELEKPEGQRDIRGRMLTERTLDKLRSYATAKK